MKTNEEKLLQLLAVAQENGWNMSSWTEFIQPVDKIEVRKDYVLFFLFPMNNKVIVKKSLNDLVTNFEKGEVSFIEALWQTTDYYNELLGRFTDVEMIRLTWTLKPTSQRLDWLFETFNHLL